MYPLPVGEATHSTDRSNAPSRARSSITRSTRTSTVGPDASPANARTGAFTWATGTPVTSAISSLVRARLTNRTPSRDRLGQATADAGPPLTVATSGGVV